MPMIPFKSDMSRRSFLKGACASVAVLSIPRLGHGLRHPSAPPDFVDFPSPEVMSRVLATALNRGGDYADLFLESTIRTNISIAAGEIRSMEYGVIQGGGIRIIQGEKTGYAYAESLASHLLNDAAKTAAAMACGGKTAPFSLSEISYPRYVLARETIEDVGVAERVAFLERIDRAARAVNPAVKQVTIEYMDEIKTYVVAHSEGVFARDRLPVIYLRVTVNASKDKKRAEGMFRTSGRQGMELLAGDMPEQAGREAAEQALRMLDAVPAPTGELPVVIAAGGGVMFHEAVGHGLEADGVIRDASVFAGRVGKRVATELVTLYDDSTMPGKRGSFNVDDEGTPASRTLLIENGVLVGYMQDRRTAHVMSADLTANGRRQSFRYPAMVRMTNTNLAPGDETPEDIIKATNRGIFAAHFGGGEVDIGSGQFTFGLREAYLIEQGKITAPIKGANLVGSGLEVLARIDRIGADFGSWPGTCGKSGQWVPVTSGCPTLRISRITVGGTAGGGGS